MSQMSFRDLGTELSHITMLSTKKLIQNRIVQNRIK